MDRKWIWNIQDIKAALGDLICQPDDPRPGCRLKATKPKPECASSACRQRRLSPLTVWLTYDKGSLTVDVGTVQAWGFSTPAELVPLLRCLAQHRTTGADLAVGYADGRPEAWWRLCGNGGDVDEDSCWIYDPEDDMCLEATIMEGRLQETATGRAHIQISGGTDRAC